MEIETVYTVVLMVFGLLFAFFWSCEVMITVSFFYYVFNLGEWASAVMIVEIIFITLKGKMKLSGIIYITLMLKLYSTKALANNFVHGFVA
jgi:hypothetical protein